MIQCKDCIWWGDPSHDRRSQRGCNHPSCQDPYAGDTSDGFGVADNEPYGGGRFVSGPEFGCIHGASGKLASDVPK